MSTECRDVSRPEQLVRRVGRMMLPALVVVLFSGCTSAADRLFEANLISVRDLGVGWEVSGSSEVVRLPLDTTAGAACDGQVAYSPTLTYVPARMLDGDMLTVRSTVVDRCRGAAGELSPVATQLDEEALGLFWEDRYRDLSDQFAGTPYTIETLLATERLLRDGVLVVDFMAELRYPVPDGVESLGYYASLLTAVSDDLVLSVLVESYGEPVEDAFLAGLADIVEQRLG